MCYHWLRKEGIPQGLSSVSSISDKANNSQSMNYFNHYVCSGDVYFYRGEKAKDGAYPKYAGGWANRPAVVISSPKDIEMSDSVFIVYLSKSACKSDWYDKFSPAQARVQICGEGRDDLCSHVVFVDKDELFEEDYMDQVTEEDLLRITNAIQNGYSSDECFLNCLYSPENRDNGPQMG